MPTTEFRLDPELVDAFLAGTADAHREAKLAEQVSALVPFHWQLPNAAAAQLTRLSRQLGGDRAAMEWLDRHPGRPRLVARLYALIRLLDRFTDEPAVVTALSDLRSLGPDPPVLARYLVRVTDEGTLASLSAQIEELLREGRDGEAVRLAFATIDWLEQAAPRAAELDAKFMEVPGLLQGIERGIAEAAQWLADH